MTRHGVARDTERVGRLLIQQALHHQAQDIRLAIREVRGIGASRILRRADAETPQQVTRYSRTDRRATREHLLDLAVARAAEGIGAGDPKRVINITISKQNLQKLALEKNPAGRKMVFKKATK